MAAPINGSLITFSTETGSGLVLGPSQGLQTQLLEVSGWPVKTSGASWRVQAESELTSAGAMLEGTAHGAK